MLVTMFIHSGINRLATECLVDSEICCPKNNFLNTLLRGGCATLETGILILCETAQDAALTNDVDTQPQGRGTGRAGSANLVPARWKQQW